MSFNSSISTLGIQDRKAQQAILRLLENTNDLNRRLKSEIRSLRTELERTKTYFEDKTK